jgi:hypothetical protein
VLRDCGSGWLGDRREGTGGASVLLFVFGGLHDLASFYDDQPRAAPTSALDLLVQERNRRCIKTLCPELDDLLGGGVAPGEITECVVKPAVECPRATLTHPPPGFAAALALARRRCASSWR